MAKDFNRRFEEFFSTEPITDLFDYLSSHWIRVCKDLKKNGVWQNLGDYPEIPTLLKHSDHLLSWYKQETGSKDSCVPEKKPQGPFSEETSSKPPGKPAIPYIGCSREIAPGRTFQGNDPESLEFQIAFLGRGDVVDELNQGLINICHKHLERLSMDMVASNARIEELRAMPQDALEECCC